ncbi:hypothetical protein Q1695_011972 [Nippostrongylus brasiliensis]|nr:hypothetical protein Q1695_011972 [Nippostrongylus brasiliensis]
MLLATLALSIIGAVFSCRLDNSIHGIFKRQPKSYNRSLVFDSTFANPIVYDEMTISTTTISDYGDCYEEVGGSYIFGLKRMGRTICYRCVTPILRSTNILQLAHQNEDICYETANEAKSSCFDATQVSLKDGTIVFRADPDPADCHIDGRFSAEYILKGGSGHCGMDSGSEMQNCLSSNVMELKLRNCSFPDFGQSQRCLGSFTAENGSHYIAVVIEEINEIRCGLVERSPDQVVTVHFSKDSRCDSLSANNAFEVYKYRAVSSGTVITPCQFPNWIRGEYDLITVDGDALEFSPTSSNSAPVISRCVHIADDRFLVYTETKCGDPIGYHCLWFAPRSESLIEFKSTSLMQGANSSVCSDDEEFEGSPWTAAVISAAMPTPCGILGSYTTPPDLQTQDCYNVTIDCDDRSSMRVTASHCATGVIFDARKYQCIASWKDENSLHMFAMRGQESHSCFVAQFSSGRLYLASTGSHCVRDFNFSRHVNDTIVLEERAGCGTLQKHPPSRKPVSPAIKSSNTVKVDPDIDTAMIGSYPIVKSATHNREWISSYSTVLCISVHAYYWLFSI